MKANELMLSDLVSYDDEIVKVENIYKHSYHYRINDDDHDVQFCKPIPLTQEILKSNGFEYNKEGFLAKQMEHKGEGTDLDDMIIIGVSDELWNESIEYYAVKIYVYPHSIEEYHFAYVHELQHALRLCGLTELADNFKIEGAEKHKLNTELYDKQRNIF